MALTESLQRFANEVQSRLLALAHSAQNVDERAAHVLALGDLGYSPVEFLRDQSPAVRMCAALAPSLNGDTTAIGELPRTLEHHAENIDDWFVEKPPQFPMRPRFRVVARLVEQVTNFDRLANAAVAILGVTSKHCVDFDWGPLLAAAFADSTGDVKTESQRRFLSALVDKTNLWDPSNGNAFKWFRDAGLPYDRKACARKVNEFRL